MLNFSLRFGGALVLLLITAGAVQAAYEMYGRLTVASTAQQEAKMQLQDLQGQEVAVSASVQELSTPRGQEALMREHYGVVRPGEGVIQIVKNTPAATAESTSTQGFFPSLFHTLFSW